MAAQRTQSKEDAPSAREYRAMKRAAESKVDEDFQEDCTFVLRMMGELGLRSGEVSHLSEHWIDFDRLEIKIPPYEPCQQGKNGGPCGYCRSQAEQMVEKNDNVSMQEALNNHWSPKNESSERTIWYGWNDDIVEMIDEFFWKYDTYPNSRSAINRRIDRIAEVTPGMSKHDVYPHAIRSYAAIRLARNGMRAFQLAKFMGWSDISGAMPYIKLANQDVRTELKRVHGVM